VGEVLLAEGERTPAMFVVVEGSFEVSRQGSIVAKVTEPGSVLGEISVLLDVDHGATVTATSEAKVHIVDDPLGFMAGDSESLLEVSRMLARRLSRLVGYIADVKAQYGGSGDHLAMLDEVLSELTYGRPRTVEAGSERDPDPIY
jgi:CRP/FNR family cyclic AMP-dependent transcriptional regulator